MYLYDDHQGALRLLEMMYEYYRRVVVVHKTPETVVSGLKDQSNEIFRPPVFSSTKATWPPDQQVKTKFEKSDSL